MGVGQAELPLRDLAAQDVAKQHREGLAELRADEQVDPGPKARDPGGWCGRLRHRRWPAP
jgi:hypothetical protein